MATKTAQEVITRVQNTLQDTGGVRWPDFEMLDWLNDGQREVCMLRPDASVKLVSVTTVAGTKQALPTDGIMLIDIIRNMGAGGATPGNVVRKIPREHLDLLAPDWHTNTATAAATHYMYDAKAPKVFYIYPPSTGTAQVEMLYSANPADIVAIDSVISLDDIYFNALVDYVLFRAYSKDSESEAAGQRSAAHRTSFENSLGLKAQSDATNVRPPNYEA